MYKYIYVVVHGFNHSSWDKLLIRVLLFIPCFMLIFTIKSLEVIRCNTPNFSKPF